MCLPICACEFVRLVLGLGLLCETRGDVPARLACVCVCLLSGLSLLCETRGDVPAPCSCVFVPRALAESIMRDSWERACPLRVCASCLGCVYCARLAQVCRPTVRACVRLVPWLSLL